MDGPVVVAARRALTAHDVSLIVPYVKADHEREVIEAFNRSLGARAGNPAANEVADLYFFDTVVRLHRAGEGAPYTGLKPAGLGFGPVVPVAEEALESGVPDALVELLTEKVRHETLERFERAMALKEHVDHGVPAARAFVDAMLGLEVWSHTLYATAASRPHGDPTGANEGSAAHQGALAHSQ